MKPFDLEAAKRGEPIEMLFCNEWHPCRFVGLSSEGHPVVETAKPSFTEWTVDKLRMAPRQTVVAIELWRDERGVYSARVVNQWGVAINECRMGAKIDTISYAVMD